MTREQRPEEATWDQQPPAPDPRRVADQTVAPRGTTDREAPTLPLNPATSDPATSDPATSDPAAVTSEGIPSARLSRPVVGSQFGDYELLEEIARGGMGVVFKARQIRLNRVVALKMILAGQFASRGEVERFHAEAQAVAHLDHPGIVPIFEIGEQEGHHFYSMLYVPGPSLADRIRQGPIPVRDAATLVAQIADAVQSAHERGIVHRDLKPANILIDAFGQPKVTDFGIAKKVEQERGLTVTGQILGTPSFMAPEQARGETSRIGPRTDVYALGANLYALLTGRPPFESASHLDAIMQVLDAEPVSPRRLQNSVPKDLEVICLKCLAKDPQQRYPTAAAVADDLARFLEGEAILARPPSLATRWLRWSRHQPGLAATWLALIAFYSYHLVSTYVLRPPDLTPEFHRTTTLITLLWGVGAWGFQSWLNRAGRSTLCVFLWVTMDAGLLTLFLWSGSGAKSPLVLGYHVLVAGAILRLMPGLVLYVTGLSVLGYVLLLVLARAALAPHSPTLQDSVPVILSLILIGTIQQLALRQSKIRAELAGQDASSWSLTRATGGILRRPAPQTTPPDMDPRSESGRSQPGPTR